MRIFLEKHIRKFQTLLVILAATVLVLTLLVSSLGGLRTVEGALSLDEGGDWPVSESLLRRLLSSSDALWRQVLVSALPRPLQDVSATGLAWTSNPWSITVSTLLYRMKISTPTTFLAMGIPVLRQVALPDPDEVLLPANEPPIPPLVQAEEPAPPGAEALGWKTVPEMLIYHTHNIESFVPTSGKAHVYDNPDQTIVRVGAKLAECLAAAGVDVVHSKADNSSQNYPLAYSHSLKTVTSVLTDKPSIEYAFDLHRDGVERPLTTTIIEGQSTARIYIVVGINTTLGHPNYQKNIAFANQLNDKLNELYPGLSRGVRITDRSRYNQHVREKALLIEVGGYQNTMDEALRAVSFLSEAIVAVVKELQN